MLCMNRCNASKVQLYGSKKKRVQVTQRIILEALLERVALANQIAVFVVLEYT